MKGLRILIVEDEFLLAMSLEDDLVAAGCSPIGPFANLTSATEATRREQFDLAILDVNLNGEVIYPLADELVSRGKPFVLLTGYGAASLPERFRNLPRLPKPYDSASLIKEIGRAVPRTG
jgi:AmiR/NasT family two-component response regulator